MIIKKEYVEKIRRDDELLLVLAKANGPVRVATIERWLRDPQNPILTTASNLVIVKRRFGLSDSEEILAEDTMQEPAEVAQS